jgi:hypothetical protein
MPLNSPAHRLQCGHAKWIQTETIFSGRGAVVRAVGWMIFVIYVFATIGGIERLISNSDEFWMNLFGTVLCIPLAGCGIWLALRGNGPPVTHKTNRIIGWTVFVGYGAALVISGYSFQAEKRAHTFSELAPLISCGATAACGLWIALTKRTDRC